MTKRAFGFRDAEGSPRGLQRVLLASGNSTIFGIGDAVVLAGDAGAIGRGGFYPTANRGAATGALFGFIVSIDQASATTPNFNQKHRPASTAMYADVMPFEANHTYCIRADASATLSSSNVGNNFLLATITDADTTLGQSKMEISSTSAATSQTGYQMTLVGIEDDGVNVIGASTPVCLVRINAIQAFPGFAGV